MIAPLAKLMDWYTLQVAAMLPSIRKCTQGNSNLTVAIEFLNGPHFIPAESKPAELQFTSDVHLEFTTPRPCEFAENNVVHGRFYRRLLEFSCSGLIFTTLYHFRHESSIPFTRSMSSKSFCAAASGIRMA